MIWSLAKEVYKIRRNVTQYMHAQNKPLSGVSSCNVSFQIMYLCVCVCYNCYNSAFTFWHFESKESNIVSFVSIPSIRIHIFHCAIHHSNTLAYEHCQFFYSFHEWPKVSSPLSNFSHKKAYKALLLDPNTSLSDINMNKKFSKFAWYIIATRSQKFEPLVNIRYDLALMLNIRWG